MFVLEENLGDFERDDVIDTKLGNHILIKIRPGVHLVPLLFILLTDYLHEADFSLSWEGRDVIVRLYDFSLTTSLFSLVYRSKDSLFDSISLPN